MTSTYREAFLCIGGKCFRLDAVGLANGISQEVESVNCAMCNGNTAARSQAYQLGWAQVAHLDRPNEWLCPKCKREVER